MFPGRIIAKQFSLGERRCSYLIMFGLAPYFKTNLTKNLESSEFFTLLFDETLNNSNQKKQLDVHVRYWKPYDNKVVTIYFGSAFLGHSTAKYILTEFYDIIGSLSLSKLLQIFMDGPSVNWSFYKTLQEDVQKQFSSKFANVGSCGLYIVNNSFRKGASSTEWNISSVLISLYWLPKDSPAGREDFLKTSITKKIACKILQLQVG
ncbi:hypothetical protein AVEN_156320-1 [Araneus ventricosus]|uniref:Uncharacterized protein n=1 Tax=Araneus ventricosus TaxID=182803 RepID=A0A4Y2L3W0_ARAVE|nr:hypothetical protein AVEN_156320-1 [Araneus ventricosus]